MSFGSIYGTSSLSNSAGLAADAQSLNNLKFEAGKDSKTAIRETAKQFESMFMRELLKSMRDANNTMKSGMLDNPGSDLGTDLLDQQFAVQMSGQPGGLSDVIANELSRKMGGSPAAGTAASSAMAIGTESNAETDPSDAAVGSPALRATTSLGAHDSTPRSQSIHTSGKTSRAPSANQVGFVQKHSDVAGRIEKASGIPASYMLGQAGHETGWGQHEIKVKGGAPSFNLFGMKAGAGWTGKVAEVTTTEYVDGAPQKRVAKFRAYDSYEDSFKDYAKMISESPRYAKARAQTGSVQAFANGLQKAGYATDPDYAAKLSRAINTTLQLRRVQV